MDNVTTAATLSLVHCRSWCVVRASDSGVLLCICADAGTMTQWWRGMPSRADKEGEGWCDGWLTGEQRQLSNVIMHYGAMQLGVGVDP